MTELKPCPFCPKGEPHMSEGYDEWAACSEYAVECKNCGNSGLSRFTAAEAIAAWNTRALPLAPDVVAALIASIDILRAYAARCRVNGIPETANDYDDYIATLRSLLPPALQYQLFVSVASSRSWCLFLCAGGEGGAGSKSFHVGLGYFVNQPYVSFGQVLEVVAKNYPELAIHALNDVYAHFSAPVLGWRGAHDSGSRPMKSVNK